MTPGIIKDLSTLLIINLLKTQAFLGIKKTEKIYNRCLLSGFERQR